MGEYIVGPPGPETLVMGSEGWIIPNRSTDTCHHACRDGLVTDCCFGTACGHPRPDESLLVCTRKPSRWQRFLRWFR